MILVWLRTKLNMHETLLMLAENKKGEPLFALSASTGES